MRFDEEVDRAAAELSRLYGKSLVIRYDDRIGYESAVLYENGERVREFNEKDELCVPLNPDGTPDLDMPPIGRTELLPNVEYEPVESAVSLGLSSIGERQAYESVRHLMTSPG